MTTMHLNLRETCLASNVMILPTVTPRSHAFEGNNRLGWTWDINIDIEIAVELDIHIDTYVDLPGDQFNWKNAF